MTNPKNDNLSVADATVKCAEILSQFSPANRARAVLSLLTVVLEKRPPLVLDVLDSAGLTYKELNGTAPKQSWWKRLRQERPRG